MIDAFEATSGAPKDMDASNAGPFNSTSLPKDIGDYLNLVAELEIGASQGVWPGRPPRFRGTRSEGMDYVIVTDADGSHHATNGMVAMSVLPEHAEPNSVLSQARLFKRVAMRNAMTPAVQVTTWLVGDIDGVKCYVKQDRLRLHIVLTRQDLYP